MKNADTTGFSHCRYQGTTSAAEASVASCGCAVVPNSVLRDLALQRLGTLVPGRRAENINQYLSLRGLIQLALLALRKAAILKDTHYGTRHTITKASEGSENLHPLV